MGFGRKDEGIPKIGMIELNHAAIILINFLNSFKLCYIYHTSFRNLYDVRNTCQIKFKSYYNREITRNFHHPYLPPFYVLNKSQ